VQERQSYEGQAVHFEQLPAREPKYRQPDQPLSDATHRALAARGIARLFEHQAQVGTQSLLRCPSTSSPPAHADYVLSIFVHILTGAACAHPPLLALVTGRACAAHA
jgi:hypothetical protein